MPAFPVLPTRRRTGSRTAAAAALVVLALAAGGCSSSSSSTPSAGPTSGASGVGGAQPMASTVVLGRVAGNLHQPNKRVFKKHRHRMLKRVGRAVDSWIDGGFVGVGYPRSDFKTAFASFTKRAKHDARRQMKLMTNWKLRKKIDGVDVKKRKVTVDAFAPHGHPAGATARVHLVFMTTGNHQKRVTVTGRLFLSPANHGSWKVFGYDMSKGGMR